MPLNILNMFHFKLNQKKYTSEKQSPTGEELLEIVGLVPASDYELFFKIGQREFEPVQPNEEINLAQVGLERFKVRRRNEVPYLLDDEHFSTTGLERKERRCRAADKGGCMTDRRNLEAVPFHMPKKPCLAARSSPYDRSRTAMKNSVSKSWTVVAERA